MIVPQIAENLTKSGTYRLPEHCPCCGTPLETKVSAGGSRSLCCPNEDCIARNVIERAKMAQATRLLSMDLDSIRRRDVVTLCADDITQPALSHKQPRRSIGFAG